MKMKKRMTRRLPVALVLAGILAAGTLLSPRAQAQELLRERGNLVTVSYAGLYTFLNLDGRYFSGLYGLKADSSAVATGLAPGIGEWKEDYDDTSGWLNGISAEIVLPDFWNASIDVQFLTGELDGDFTISPVGSPMRFKGNADVDRDIFELGASVPFYDWFYARAEYFNHQDDTTWKYSDGSVEKQEYMFQGVRAGVGAKQDFELGSTGLVLTVDGFVGGVYFDGEHKEKTVNATKDWEGWGYILRTGAQLAYPLSEQFSIVGETSYEFMHLSDDELDLNVHGFNMKLGVSGSF